VLRDALATSAAGTDFIRRDLDALLDGDYLRSFGLDRCYEELATVTGIARELDVPFALSETVEEIHRRALELLAVALLEEEAGARLRHGPEAAGELGHKRVAG
jgi:3-hydroxyisobutyrate dehydrogenase-like beta-hydroxyacid dehydrogenase